MSWQLVSGGLPEPEGDSLWYFCWGPGWSEPMVLEFWPQTDSFLGGFGDSGGHYKEVTHFQKVILPQSPEQK